MFLRTILIHHKTEQLVENNLRQLHSHTKKNKKNVEKKKYKSFLQRHLSLYYSSSLFVDKVFHLLILKA